MAFPPPGNQPRLGASHAIRPQRHNLHPPCRMGIGLAACENTVRGVGRDMQETGEAVEDTMQGNP